MESKTDNNTRNNEIKNNTFRYTETDILKNHELAHKSEVDPQVKYRRLRNLLSTSSFGVIIFGLWSIIRSVLYVLFSRESQKEIDMTVSETGAESSDVLMVIVILMLVILGLEIALRLFVGLSARAESKGKKKSIAYVIVAGILIPFYVMSVIYSIASTDYINGVVDNIITIIMDITSTLALIELFVAAISIRVMRKKYGKDSFGDS